MLFLYVTSPSPSLTPVPTPAPSALSWQQTLASLIVAVVTGLVVAYATHQLRERGRLKERNDSDARDAQDMLSDVRQWVRRCRVTNDDAQENMLALQTAQDGLERVTGRLFDEATTEAVKRYIEVGNLFAAHDPLTGEGDEADSYDEIAACLRIVFKQTSEPARHHGS